MNARWAVRLAIGLVVSVVTILLLVSTIDVPATVARLTSVETVWLVLPLVALATQLAIRADRWALLLSASVGTPIRAGRVIGPLAVGYLANAVLPARLGEVARAVLVARREHLAIAAVAASVIVERVVDLSALLSVGLVSTGAIGTIGPPAIVATVATIVALGALAFNAGSIANHLPRRLPVRLRDMAAQFLRGIAGVGARTSLVAYGLSALAWLGDVAVIWACAQALGVDLTLTAAVAIAVGAALGTALPAASGYLGTYEIGAVALGSLAGTAPDVILAIAVLAHVFAVLPMAIVGLVAGARMGVRFAMPTLDRPGAAAPDVGAGRL